MPRLNFAAMAAAGTVFLAACQSEPDQPRPGTEPVTLGEAVALTDKICGATRPSFAAAEQRMVQHGLTTVKDGRHYSVTKAVSAKVDANDGGLRTCTIRATYTGNSDQLREALTKRFGSMKTKDQIGSPFINVYNHGSKGKILVLLQPHYHKRANMIFDIGYASGL